MLLYAATLAAGTADPVLVAALDAGAAARPVAGTVAGALAVLGFATKAGLAPMHSWLPDAHSQAPAPVSGLMSGVLLSVAFYAILRVQAVVDPVVGPGLMRGMLVTAGLLSLAIAALLILRQRDLKRMLAYSSMEHMGLLALAAAIGSTLALSAALLHVLGHGLAKSSTFVISGRVLSTEGTTTHRRQCARCWLAGRPSPSRSWSGCSRCSGCPRSVFSSPRLASSSPASRRTWRGLWRQRSCCCSCSSLLSAGTPSPCSSATPPMKATTNPTGVRTGLGFRSCWALGTTAVIGFASGSFATLLTEAANVLGGA